MRHWKQLCEELENDVWGAGYKIVTGKLTNNIPPKLSTEQKRDVLRNVLELFPSRNELMPNPCCEEVELFTLVELKTATWVKMVN